VATVKRNIVVPYCKPAARLSPVFPFVVLHVSNLARKELFTGTGTWSIGIHCCASNKKITVGGDKHLALTILEKHQDNDCDEIFQERW
jgi:hypothetical protein